MSPMHQHLHYHLYARKHRKPDRQLGVFIKSKTLTHKSCGSSEVIFERLSGYFQSIPVRLTVEIGHLTNMSKTLEISDIDQQLTINHNQRTFHYQLAGFSVHLGNHFYSILCNKGEYYKYDGMLTTGTTTIWNVNNSLETLILYFTSCAPLINCCYPIRKRSKARYIESCGDLCRLFRQRNLYHGEPRYWKRDLQRHIPSGE